MVESLDIPGGRYEKGDNRLSQDSYPKLVTQKPSFKKLQSDRNGSGVPEHPAPTAWASGPRVAEIKEQEIKIEPCVINISTSRKRKGNFQYTF